MSKELDNWFDGFLEEQMFGIDAEEELREMWDHMNEDIKLSYAEYRDYNRDEN